MNDLENGSDHFFDNFLYIELYEELYPAKFYRVLNDGGGGPL